MMKTMIALLAMLSATGAIAVEAQPGNRSGASIPVHFHGRWAENQRACRPRHFTTAITIDRGGWSSFEEGGRVTRVGQIRRGTHYFRMRNYAGADESTGSLALRRYGRSIVVTFQDDNEKPVHRTLIRCR
jgi:hypothetical protein